VGGIAPLHSKQTEYIPAVRRLFYRCGLDCSILEKFYFTNFILPPADKMAVAVTDSLKYHLDTTRAKTTLQALLSSLAAHGVDVTTHQAEATLPSDGPNGVGAIAMGTTDTLLPGSIRSFSSLTSRLPLFYVTTLKKNPFT
jgi:hypothetical protein